MVASAVPAVTVAKAAAAVASTVVGYKVLDSKAHISSDLSAGFRMTGLLKLLFAGRRTDDYCIPDLWAEGLAKWADKPFVIFEHRRLTWRDTDMLATQLAHWLLAQGFKRDDVLALVMENRAEFVAWWLAISKIGAQAALINFNIKQKGLVHCIRVASAVGAIFDSETEANLVDVEGDLDGVKLIYFAGVPTKPFKQILTVTHDSLLAFPRDDRPFKEMRKGIKMASNFGFIYTSGTTGLPKAAKIMHVKFASMGAIIQGSGMGPSDRLYSCLPIFHSSAGGIGVMGCILSGATLVLARKFSASRFWPEIVAHECTGFQYIGELGRYLVNYAKEHPEVLKLKHKLRMAVGNGLRPETWNDFQDGFRIPLVCEFYGATEGNGALLNFCHRGDLAARGAVGRLGSLMSLIMKVKLVKFNVETEEVVRGSNGFCIECDYGEPGELIFANIETDPAKKFVGYTDPKATAKKLLSDVFVKGDSWFRSGDLLSRDKRGFFYFVDRVGDTFRWKGENCSTMEVSEVVSSFPGVEEANVYGVKVPGSMDGRACMAAVNAPEALQAREKLDALQKLCEKELPKYAQPLFIRFLPAMDITGTFKHQKVQLREQGCDPNTVKDRLFWLSPESRRYEPFGPAEYALLETGRSKL